MPIDLSHFYDSVQLDQLAGFALLRGFPACVTHHSLVFREAVHYLCAENAVSEGIRPTNRLVAGCPFAMCHARLYLHDLMVTTQRSVNQVPRSLSTWVDDISVDCRFVCEDRLVDEAVAAFETLRQGLCELKLTISSKKSGFLCSSGSLAPRLQEALKRKPDVPKVHDVLKDLGADATAGRLIEELAIKKQEGSRQGDAFANLKFFLPEPERGSWPLMFFMLWGAQQFGIPCVGS